MAQHDLLYRKTPETARDKIAYGFVKFLRFIADSFFKERYGHRAVVLETVAGVPGMVGGMLQHMKCLRRMTDDHGWIRKLLDEAENERMHLMTFIEIAQPNAFERALVLMTQGIFFNCYFVLYLLSPKTAHRFVGYLEEEAVVSYTHYLKELETGRHENVPAPKVAIDYWKLTADARLSDVVTVIRDDEAGHRDANHHFADTYEQVFHEPRHQRAPHSLNRNGTEVSRRPLKI